MPDGPAASHDVSKRISAARVIPVIPHTLAHKSRPKQVPADAAVAPHDDSEVNTNEAQEVNVSRNSVRDRKNVNGTVRSSFDDVQQEQDISEPSPREQTEPASRTSLQREEAAPSFNSARSISHVSMKYIPTAQMPPPTALQPPARPMPPGLVFGAMHDPIAGHDVEVETALAIPAASNLPVRQSGPPPAAREHVHAHHHSEPVNSQIYANDHSSLPFTRDNVHRIEPFYPGGIISHGPEHAAYYHGDPNRIMHHMPSNSSSNFGHLRLASTSTNGEPFTFPPNGLGLHKHSNVGPTAYPAAGFNGPLLGFLDLPQAMSVQSPFEEADGLIHFARSQFARPAFADTILHISHNSYMFPPIPLPSHGLLLARSPKLRSLLAMSQSDQYSFPRQLHLSISDNFVNHHIAPLKALMTLYGDRPVAREFVDALFASKLDKIQFVLAYAAAGHALELDGVIKRGLDFAAQLLDWMLVSKALAFALDGGLGPSWSSVDASTESQSSAASAADPPSRIDSPASAPSYGVYSDWMLGAIMDFMVHAMPDNIRFVSDAAQLPEVPRLPRSGEPRHVRSDSKLSQIRFGDLALDDQEDIAFREYRDVSSVLLSLPFALLKRLLEHEILQRRLGRANVQYLAQAVVAEREVRRQRAAQSDSGQTDADDTLRQNLGWVESLEKRDDRPAVLVMHHRVDKDTPASSASVNSQGDF